MIDSYLGSTGKNLQKVFDYASMAPCVLFMDEFDCIAVDRGESNDVGEARRVTNQLLLMLDRLPATCVFVAATNLDSVLDRAIRRRFDFALEIPAPSRELRLRCVERELMPSMTPGFDLSPMFARIADLAQPNLSALVQLCERVRRDLVLNAGSGLEQIITAAQSERA